MRLNRPGFLPWIILFLTPVLACALPSNPPLAVTLPPASTPELVQPFAGAPVTLTLASGTMPSFAPLAYPDARTRTIPIAYSFGSEQLANPGALSSLNARKQIQVGRQGFVGTPFPWPGFYELYERATENGTPIYITADAVLYTAHMLIATTVDETRRDYLIADLRELNRAMVQTAQQQLASESDSALQEAAFRNLAFFAIGAALLDGTTPPEVVSEIATEELTLIEGANGIFISPLTAAPHDYSLYQLPASLRVDEQMRRYQAALTWFRRPLLDTRAGTDQVRRQARQSLLLLSALESTQNFSRWHRLYSVESFLDGATPDLTMQGVQEAADAVYGSRAGAVEVDDFVATLRQFPHNLLRWMPAPQDHQATILANLSGDRAGGYSGPAETIPFTASEASLGTSRSLPHPFDIAAAYGSVAGLDWMSFNNETAYEGYFSLLEEQREMVMAMNLGEHTASLPQARLHALQPLASASTELQMAQNDAWMNRQLNSWYGGWALSMIPTMPLPAVSNEVVATIPTVSAGYVEPAPAFFARQAGMMLLLQQGLSQRGILSPETSERLQRFARLLQQFRVIAENENSGSKDQEIDEVAAYRAFLRLLAELQAWEPALPAIVEYWQGGEQEGQRAAAALGDVWPLYVIVPIDGQPTLTIGGIFSDYLLKYEPDQAINSEQWRFMIDRPSPAPWQESYLVP